MPVRERLKRLVEPGLAASGLPALARHRLAGRTLILAYHNIVPDGAAVTGDASLHLGQTRFAEQLDLLCQSHDVIPLERALDDRPSPRGRPRVAITFDDAYRGAVTAGVEEVSRRGLPATIFVAPGLLGGGLFWWDVVASAAAPAATRAAWREHAVHALGGRQEEVLRWLETTGIPLRAVEAHATPATEDELHAACQHPGIALGAHSWSHPNLASLTREVLQRELRTPLDWLRERFSSTVSWLAYPYGITSPAVMERTQAVGYDGAVLVEGGWVRPGARDRFGLPRLTIPAQLTGDGFLLRSSGLVRR